MIVKNLSVLLDCFLICI